MRGCVWLSAAVLLAGCAAPGTGRHGVPSGPAAAAAELDPSGKPYRGPSVVATSPPADNGSPRLSCHPQGIGEECDRGGGS